LEGIRYSHVDSTSKGASKFAAEYRFRLPDFILDFDAIPTKKNGHKLGCTCKKCMALPRSEEAKALAGLKPEAVLHPLNKKRF
jgi:hypothetical protein